MHILQNIAKIEHNPNGKFVIWGAGNTTLYYEKICLYENINIKYIVDSNAEKVGSTFCGYQVLDPSVLEDETATVLISTTDFRTYQCIKGQLTQINKRINFYSFDEYVLRKNLDNIYKVANFFDNDSKEKYELIIRSRITGMPIHNNVYSLNLLRYNEGREFQTPRHDDIIIDAGAFVGDSLEKFLFEHDGIFKKYFAFEPNKRDFTALQNRRRRLIKEWALREDSIVLLNKCLTNTSGYLHLHNWELGGGGSAVCSKDANLEQSRISKVQSTNLDEFLHEEPVTFIKADIEGSEFAMLTGAKHILMRYKPRVAISVYHNPSDLYRIPMFLKNLGIGYKFYFRHYSYTWGDSVLYAV